ncbi:hypothetical protein Taro_006328 [Colocasia esculenta]|uniref:Uncharacterized protein n=1 Tax=Colocasia esculenta TaxID=4460 RepID=A0A843TS86_COLES|nr:hypothetical protein [Colocasia esculenta]
MLQCLHKFVSVVSTRSTYESLGLVQTGREVGETEDEQLDRLVRGCRETLASEPGAQADLDLRHFLTFFLRRVLFATRGDAVHCRLLPLLEDLDRVGEYAWGLDLPPPSRPGEGDLGVTRPCAPSSPLGAVPRHTPSGGASSVVWQPYLEEGDEGQPWLEQARPYFGRATWVHALNLVLPLHLHLTQRSLGLRQSAVEFPSRCRTPRPSRSFWGLHDTTDWREWAREQIADWEHKGRRFFALKYGTRVYRSARRQVDVTEQIASLQVLLRSTVQTWDVVRREAEQLELTSVPCAACGVDEAEGDIGRCVLISGSGRDLPV